MQKIRTILLYLAAIVMLSGCNIQNKEESTISYNEDYIQCNFYNKQDFLNINNDNKFKIPDGEIKGGIIPHHLLAKDIIHEFFSTIQSQEYDLIVIIGPDHKSRDKKKNFTTMKNWKTPYGIVETDKEIVNKLIMDKVIVVNDYKMEEEHSVSSIIPFIKYYFPKCKVVPIAVSCFLQMNDINNLSNQIYNEIKDKKSLIIASVDFSHYLNYEEANKKDEITKEALLSKDIQKIYTFTNDNMDSPETIITLLNIMDKQKAYNETILRNLNSCDIVNKYNEQTTSYLTVVYYK